ncbi:MAG: ABC transporter permease [Anaerolineales bacterium]|nr:ABC transporter permease [Anaerolineales bacterium]MCS7248487.1 ABC transporter permease [Anaerolineales bacterium]MDW8162300.1 ABC transporter permease [Anaerolineales bacterium]MDW8448076.1 ABC transporter permease [Anaerolineales bacterium]
MRTLPSLLANTAAERLSHSIRALLQPLGAVLAALVVGAALIALTGVDPFFAYQKMWEGIAKSNYQIGLVLVKATPLLIIGLGLGLAFNSGVFNIGAEGQLYMGALIGTAIAIQAWGLPAWLHILLSLVGGFVGGGLWGLLPGYLKARHNINEVITTILLNYIAIYIVSYFTHGPLRDNPFAEAALPQTPEVQPSSQLPLIWPPTRLHAGFPLGILLAAILYIVTYRMAFGYKARAVGSSPAAAHYAGMNPTQIMVIVMVVSGGLAGIAGTVEILGVQHRLRDMFSPGLGYSAIAIALMGNNHPLGILLASVVFGALQVGANNMQALAGVPVTIVDVIQAMVIFFVAVGAIIRWRAPLMALFKPKRVTSD